MNIEHASTVMYCFSLILFLFFSISSFTSSAFKHPGDLMVAITSLWVWNTFHRRLRKARSPGFLVFQTFLPRHPQFGLVQNRLKQIVSSKGQKRNKCLLLQLCVPQPFECFDTGIKMNKAKSCQAWFWVAGLVGLELLELAGLPGWWVRSHCYCPNILVLAMNSE